MTDPLVGTTVSHYEVLGTLGGGGMGVVYTARDTKLGRRVALKFLPPQWSHDESAKQRFIREAQAASATDHKNICTIHDIDTAPDGRLFIVMAQYEGPTLKQRLEQGPLPTEEAIEIAAQLAEGLARAHAQGVVHRDVKPGNIILTEDGLRILDFGLARFAGSLNLTFEGSTLGTVAYMSPEQSRGEDLDGRSDIWSIGVVLYEMLTGELPFRGGYPEAITHAIRTEPTPVLRKRSAENLDAVERVIRRALEKDPAQRYESARDLARDLRLIQGRTLPIDLRTGTIVVDETAKPKHRHFWTRRAVMATAAAVVAIAGTLTWLFLPLEGIPIVVAPIVNQTGYAELEPYRLALTQELVTELSDSSVVRVFPYDRLLQIIRRFRVAGEDVSSRDALQAISGSTRAQQIIVPTLLYENGSWRARLEFRQPTTAINVATVETASVTSSLVKDTAYGLVPALAEAVNAHFVNTSYRRRLHAWASRLTKQPTEAKHHLASLDAAAEFERGIDAYERLEYAAALREFTNAARTDPASPLVAAWRSRAAWLMRQDRVAVEAADAALRLLTPETAPATALFARAVSAEARRETAMAEALYRELAANRRDDSLSTLELAAFQDRATRNRDAIASFQQIVAADDLLIRPRIDLCRLYNRINESANAKEYGRQALEAAVRLGDRAIQAQALFCLTDTLRVGTPDERKQARVHAKAASDLLQGISADYQRSRANYYVGMAAWAEGAVPEAIAEFELAVQEARRTGNLQLEPLLLMNLGVFEERRGRRARAEDYYRDSYMAYELLGDNPRAAQIQANRGALLIEYGPDPDEGRRDVENALAVARKLGDRTFEMFCLQMVGVHDRNAGRYADAVRAFNQAIAISRERDLKDDLALLTADVARSQFDVGDYAAARPLFTEALRDGTGRRATEIRIRLAATLLNLGDSAAADELRRASEAVTKGAGDPGLAALLHTANGQMALRSGRLEEARGEFAAAAALWVDDQPDAAAVEGRMYLGVVDLTEGHLPAAKRSLESTLAQARRMGRYNLEVRSRLFLANVALKQRRFEDALDLLKPVPPDGERVVGAALQMEIAQVREAAAKGEERLISKRT